MLGHERGQRLAGIREQHVLDERDAAGGAFDVGQDDAGLHGSGRLGGYVTGELLRDVGAGEVTDPAIRLGEEADRHEARLVAHVEPVGGAIGHGDQVILHTLDLVDLVTHVQGEQARAGHEEAHLVFLVEVFVEELLAQFRPVRVVRGDRGHVHALEATLGDQAVDVGAVGGEHFILAGTRRDRRAMIAPSWVSSSGDSGRVSS
ncbi:hypothetical protein G6F57_017550 [Rhizopus arrhizus]|nr:hypothetical protein G6F57_017550 [Rhizopus arrhizus]